MPRIRNPRRGSMQFWPRKRAKKLASRIRSWTGKNTKILGFAGYKVGMTHLIITDNKPTSITKGEEIQMPVTILECPPIKIASILLYKKTAYGLKPSGQIHAEKLDKELAKKISLPKKQPKNADTTNIADVRLLAYTQPKTTTIGKKKPELIELGIGGKVEEKLKYAQSILGKEIPINDVFTAGQFVDLTAVTKGKGTQGPVKRFGVNIRVHKSEKTKRGPGSLGPWHGHRTYRVAHAGQTGYQQRTEHNKHIIKISGNPEEIQKKAGFSRYGLVKNQYILIKGSVAGAKKRIITLTEPRRTVSNEAKEPPIIVYTQQ
ncbi:50S ribosomal protein L3 [Candidatus Woesearchaeota archaeon CG10_big_fil_rev_8_21_14_0_10_37_12]|nr:MAG: 50S ribosomal protein L3 [Candidatus Woesearchaeota archaeon CG10_big_fil_rev_8_21_14_0_10_37_12]